MWNQEDRQPDRYQAQKSIDTKKGGERKLSKMEQILPFKSCQIEGIHLGYHVKYKAFTEDLFGAYVLMEKKGKGNLKASLPPVDLDREGQKSFPSILHPFSFPFFSHFLHLPNSLLTLLWILSLWY